MAEGIMRKKLEDHGLKHHVDSTGTANYHVGEHPDHRAIEKAKKYGIDISELIGRQFTSADFDNFDVIYAMDTNNVTNILRSARSANDKKKVKLILNEIYPESGISVPDPFHGGDVEFENVYSLLTAACEKICQDLKGS
jgi:protein-tyrosine phosphatase